MTSTLPIHILELRQISSRVLEVLFAEEARHWKDELLWDYRPSLDLIRKFIDSRALGGYVAMEESRAAGYGFYVLEERKGLIGGLFVSSQAPQAEITEKLLNEMLSSLLATPRIERVEAQLMPFGTALDSIHLSRNFRLYPRQFMLLRLNAAQLANRPLSTGLRLDAWSDKAFEACARLIQLAYANHIDGDINDQYRTEAGGLKFLRNIVILPGCGQFLPEASFVARPVTGDGPIGMVLTSRVSEGVGHTTQICVQPGYQGHGLGRHLMETAIRALRARQFHSLSLTVTSINAPAVRLYEKLGFDTIKKFAAGVWKA
jgi:GNAT superfamily N-acetyltransferase